MSVTKTAFRLLESGQMTIFRLVVAAMTGISRWNGPSLCRSIRLLLGSCRHQPVMYRVYRRDYSLIDGL
jgi:hypothetical protein